MLGIKNIVNVSCLLKYSTVVTVINIEMLIIVYKVHTLFFLYIFVIIKNRLRSFTFSLPVLSNAVFISVCSEMGVTLPDEGMYGTGIIFMDKNRATRCEVVFEEIAKECNLKVSSVPRAMIHVLGFL